MGVAVSLNQNLRPTTTNDNESIPEGELILDDGTALLSIVVEPYMMERFRCAQVQLLGQTLECVVAKDTAPTQHGAFWMAQQVAIVEDPHEEILRWWELICRDDQNIRFIHGMLPAKTVTADDVFQFIQWDTNTVQEESKQRAESEYDIPDDGIDRRPGVDLVGLADCLQINVETAEELLADLQLTGQIYRNGDGLYLPL